MQHELFVLEQLLRKMNRRYDMLKVPDILKGLTDQYCEARFADSINVNNFSVDSLHSSWFGQGCRLKESVRIAVPRRISLTLTTDFMFMN